MAQPPKRGEIAVLRTAGRAPSHALVAVDSVCSEVPSCGPELAPDVARQRRGVAVQQRAQHDLAAQLGQALDELVGAGDHHLALLDAALADRGLLGQPLALGLHRVGLGRRRRWPAWLPAAPAACACRRGRCGRSWPPPPRRRARRLPARAGRRSRPAAGSACSARVAMRSSWRVHSSTSWPNGRCGWRRGLGQRRAGAATSSRRSHARRMGKRTQASLFGHGLPRGPRGPSCRPILRLWGPNLGGFPRLFRVG